MLERYFRIAERGSTVAREVRGGLVTFVTMAYIVVLNPLIIGSFAADEPGAKTDVLGNVLPVPQVAAVTALVAGVLTLLMGLVTNYPFALATGLGINSFVALTMAPMMTWPQVMGLVVLNGLIVLILVVTGIRTAVFNAVPAELKAAIAVGIGLFICFIGFVDAGFVRRLPDAAGTTVPVGLGVNGSLATWPTAVFAVGLLGTVALVARRVRGALLLGCWALRCSRSSSRPWWRPGLQRAPTLGGGAWATRRCPIRSSGSRTWRCSGTSRSAPSCTSRSSPWRCWCSPWC